MELYVLWHLVWTDLTGIFKSRLLRFINLFPLLAVTLVTLVRLGLIIDYVVYLLVMLAEEWIVDPLKILLEVLKRILHLSSRVITLILSSILMLLLWLTSRLILIRLRLYSRLTNSLMLILRIKIYFYQQANIHGYATFATLTRYISDLTLLLRLSVIRLLVHWKIRNNLKKISRKTLQLIPFESF